MAATNNSPTRELDQTPTWAVATVVAVIIMISFSLELILHRLGKWFTDKRKNALFEALEKVKCELMILGFISLLLTFGQVYISQICIPVKLENTMLPCPYRQNDEEPEKDDAEQNRKLLWNERRILVGGSKVFKCKEGYSSLISANGVHQIHIFIFFLAVFHVAYSAATMGLGRLKIRGWKEWEKETLSNDHEFSNDPSRFRLSHETSFVKSHNSIWNRIPFLFYISCFIRQFFRSIRKADYLTLRHGFIAVHISPGCKFDFQKYIKRSLEDDFKVVVGISPLLWATLVIFMLLNVNGWQSMFWVSIIPLLIISAVGTKLQAIIGKMALEIQERHSVVQGIPLVNVSDKYFWFSWPQLILYLIHFSLFQNAFQITYFFWIWYAFGLKSCFHQNLKLILARVALGIGVQFLCSYITLPLYALVTQMGSTMKKSVFDEQTSKAIMNWRMTVKKKSEGRSGRSPTTSVGPSPMTSPVHPLQRLMTTGHVTSSFNKKFSEPDISENERDDIPMMSSTAINMDNGDLESEIREQPHNKDDFSLVKPERSRSTL